ncbi:MAG TPA: ubiquinol-cytochrome c reductase iron-sulfur subunit [Vitreimonas sp.]|nr:ubiquinol-cytochrome c reductase iron-sulfur subunit [Vitreimonas sp.]
MTDANADAHAGEETTRRDFIFIAVGAVATVGTAATIWPFIDQMNPAADTRAMSTTEVDLSAIQVGQQIKAVWQGTPVFVRHRTQAEISQAIRDDYAQLKDPQMDIDRIKQADGKEGKREWLILKANCTHLGCIPLPPDNPGYLGHYGGWFCPCHGSDYDTSGRIRSGPAPKNLYVAPYTYLTDHSIRIG